VGIDFAPCRPLVYAHPYQGFSEVFILLGKELSVVSELVDLDVLSIYFDAVDAFIVLNEACECFRHHQKG
jgi:hypothetical protein